jgi:hypothetical protein
MGAALSILGRSTLLKIGGTIGSTGLLGSVFRVGSTGLSLTGSLLSSSTTLIMAAVGFIAFIIN